MSVTPNLSATVAGRLGIRCDGGQHRLIERPVNPSLESHARGRDECKPGGLARAVDLIEDDECLANDGTPRLERPATKFPLEPTHRALGCEIQVVRLEFLPRLAFDAHLGMSAAKGHRIPAKFD